MPVLTLQNAQARVQVSPRIMTVACFLVQHSPMLGHAASSQTVARFLDRINRLVSAKPALVGALTRIQSGLRCRSGRALSGSMPLISFMLPRLRLTGLLPSPFFWDYAAAMADFNDMLAGYRRFRGPGWDDQPGRWCVLGDEKIGRARV